MKDLTKCFLILLAASAQFGCASYFKRQQCESINWFEHGQSVAMKGQWLNADPTVNECRKAEANIRESELDRGFKSGVQKYCSKENIFLTGKNGDFFSQDICNGPELQVLTTEHQRGVEEYCTKENGFSAGASGKKYQNICPKKLENNFLAEYKKGRKKYIDALISNKRDEIRGLEIQLVTKRNDLSYARGAVSSLESQKNLLDAQKNNALALKNTAMTDLLDSQINNLNTNLINSRSTLTQTENEVKRMEAKKETLEKEISSLQAELPGLDAIK